MFLHVVAAVSCGVCRCGGAAEAGAAEAALVPHAAAGTERPVPLRGRRVPSSPRPVDKE